MWNAKRERALLLVALAGCLWLGGCRQASRPLQPSIFTNPNEVTLVCFSTDRGAADPTLPLDCCDSVLGDDTQASDKAERCGWSETDGKLAAVTHALVTQVQRGEVAAVDLEQKVVLDSDKRIPGYTFVDVGGLPAAIVVRSGAAGERPHWTYVAGRERNSLRAVATCRFKIGKACGPELSVDEATELALAGEPFDMVLAADERGLWLTLRNEGLLAYVPLPDSAGDAAPFAGDVVYYPLPGGFDATPPEAVSEAAPYRFACRFDESKASGGVEPEGDEGGEDEPVVEADMSDPAPWQAQQQVMPRSLPAASRRVARPTLLRMVDLNPRGESDPTRKLLFVADEGQMAVHVYARDAAGELTLLTSAPVGAPLRDFAVTPEVPVSAPSYARLLTDTYYESERATTRYLYAIDQRDGSLMAFSLTFEAGIPKLVPLLAPLPARDIMRHGLNRSDRLSLGREQESQARALEVVDTRLRRRADGSFDDAHCHVDDLTRDLEELDLRADAAKGTFDEDPTPQNRREWLLAADDLAVPTNADPFGLRGVFLMVATTRGTLSVLDVHDLDLECRAKLQCAEKTESETGVVIARHTPRISGTEVPTISISPPAEIASASECPEGYEPRAGRDGRERLCLSKDPWLAQGFNFSIGYEAPFTSAIPDAVLQDAGDGRILLKAPEGVDLCARGANVNDELLVGILSQPDSVEMSGGRCEVTFSSVPLLRVLEARRDELLLVPYRDEVDTETLLACYRHLVAFDLRVRDQYLVRSDLVGYQHRNMSGPDGTCVADDDLDTRFTSRASLDEPFLNQFLSFTLTARGVTVDAGAPSTDAGADDAGGEDEEGGVPDEDGGTSDEDGGAAEADAGVSGEDGGAADEDEPELSDTERARRREVNPTITITTGIQQVSAAISGANPSRNDVLPHRVRYFPDNNYLFVVDQASQGLRRFLMQPRFAADTDSIF